MSENREEMYVDTMRLLGGLITSIYDREADVQTQELYQLSHILDQLLYLAPSQAGRNVGGGVAIFNTLHRGNLVGDMTSSTARKEAVAANNLPLLTEATTEHGSLERAVSPSNFFRYEGHWEGQEVDQHREASESTSTSEQAGSETSTIEPAATDAVAAPERDGPEPAAQEEAARQVRTFTYEIPEHTPTVCM
jgi:hypothetical protein